MEHPITIAIHGGASDIANMGLSPEQEQAYQQGLTSALDSGYAILKNGGSSVDAVEAAIRVLEDDPLFNAGKGSVYTRDGRIEMDAAIMDGATRKCGAIAGVRKVKNPISGARLVMDSSRYVFLFGKGAEKFLTNEGMQLVDTSYFRTEFRWQQHLKMVHKDTTQLDNDSRAEVDPIDERVTKKYGTVGCVALDHLGHLAAATSTGGVANKRWRRIGDSPVIGAGTYANDATCAISCTGKGEDFIRLVLAKGVSDRMSYRNDSLQVAVRDALKELVDLGGRGGLIAVDREGHVVMEFTTSGMFRGTVDSKGNRSIAIYGPAGKTKALK
jgi:beta-aspartyl-peptidase (threonine type)